MKSINKKESTTSRITRRQIIKGISLGLLGGAGPWITTSARAAGQLTVILNQGLLAKLWIDELNPKFEKETGAKLNIQQSVTGNMLAAEPICDLARRLEDQQRQQQLSQA